MADGPRVLAADEPWAPAGHEVAWGQVAMRRRRRVNGGHSEHARGAGEAASSPPAAIAAPRRTGAGAAIELGPGVFDAATGVLARLGDLALRGPRLDLWRAPTDNDEGYHGPEQLAAVWRAHGLDRLRHRTISVKVDRSELVVRTRVAPAASDLGFAATYRWTAEDGALALALEVVPDRRWDFPLPRLGVRLAIPAGPDRVEWFGRGPGEAYPDSRLAARVGRFTASVAELQTPYVMPAGERQPHRGPLGADRRPADRRAGPGSS